DFDARSFRAMNMYRAAVVVLGLMLIAGASACGSSAKSAAPPVIGPSSTSSMPPSTPTTNASSPTVTPAHAGANATEADNGKTVSAKVGEQVNVVLGSTYWTFGPVSNASVLKLNGAPAIAPTLRGCVPGGGCGTVTASYDAIAPGTAVV